MDNLTNPAVSQSSQRSLPGAVKLLGYAFSTYKKQFSLFLGISAIPFALGVVQILMRESLSGGLLQNGLVFVVLIVTFVVGFLSNLALFSAVTEEGQSVVGAYRKSIKMFFPFIWVIGLLALAITGGFFLFIIPGILLSVWFSFPIFVLFAENRRGISALVASWHYVKGYWWAVCWRSLFWGIIVGLVGIVLPFITGDPNIFTSLNEMGVEKISLLGQILNLFLNYLIFLPLAVIYFYGIYKSLKEMKTSVPLESDERKIKRNVIIFSVVGIVGIVTSAVLLLFVFIKFLPQLSPDLESPTSFPVSASSVVSSVALSPLLDFLSFDK